MPTGKSACQTSVFQHYPIAPLMQLLYSRLARLGHLFIHDCFANGRKREACEFEMLNAKRDADNGDEAGEGGNKMADG